LSAANPGPAPINTATPPRGLLPLNTGYSSDGSYPYRDLSASASADAATVLA